MSKVSRTISKALEKLPPFVCRLIARTDNGRRGLSHSELAKISGLNRSTVKELSMATSWGGYTLSTIQSFSTACGVNHLAVGKQVEFLKRRKWVHVENASGNQSKLYRRLTQLLVEEAKKRARPVPSNPSA